MRQPKLDAQSGFSLVELMVAMTVTTISGAIFGRSPGGTRPSAGSRSWPTASRTSVWPWT